MFSYYQLTSFSIWFWQLQNIIIHVYVYMYMYVVNFQKLSLPCNAMHHDEYDLYK